MTTASILHHVCGTNPAKGLFTRLITKSEPTKTCTKCGESKAVALFSKDKKRKDGLKFSCKSCDVASGLAHRTANKEKIRLRHSAYYLANKESLAVKAASLHKAAKERNQSARAEFANIATHKTCKKCNESKLVDEFSLHTSKKDGLQIYCKACISICYSKSDATVSRVAEYRKENRTLLSNKQAAWRESNQDVIKVLRHTRRSREKSVGGTLSMGVTKLLMSEQAGKCACCLVDLLTTGHHLDHVVPISKGGPNVDSNIQLLCPTCNHEKSAKHPLAWMAAKGIFTP